MSSIVCTMKAHSFLAEYSLNHILDVGSYVCLKLARMKENEFEIGSTQMRKKVVIVFDI